MLRKSERPRPYRVVAIALVLTISTASLPAVTLPQSPEVAAIFPQQAQARISINESSRVSPTTTFPDGGGTITRFDLGPKGNPGYNPEGAVAITADGRTVFFNSFNLFFTTPDGIQLGNAVPWARDRWC